MHVMMVGVNHRTAGVELRERLAMAGDRLDQAVTQFRARFPLAEVVLLSTCNRTELYLARPTHEPPTFEQAREFLVRQGGDDGELLAESIIRLDNDHAATHLFRVAVGLESMVLGEPQVLGQVKRAYEAAQSLGAVGPVLHKLFQRAIREAKRVRSSTGIDSGRVSVGSAAVDFARRIFEQFDDKTVVGIGAGELAGPMLEQLKRLGPAKLWVTNRSLGKARGLMETLGLKDGSGGVRRFDELNDLLVEADIIVTSTGATRPIITAQRFKPLLRRRRGRPLFVIDIAVPRDVDPAVGELNNVYLYNIDDLQRVVADTFDQRSEVVERCEALLAQAVGQCMAEIQNRDIGQLVRALRQRLHDIGDHEQQRLLRKAMASGPDELHLALPELIGQHTQRLINKILHLPLSRLDHRQAGASLGFYAAALRSLFDLDQPWPGQEDENTSAEAGPDINNPAETSDQPSQDDHGFKPQKQSVKIKTA